MGDDTARLHAACKASASSNDAQELPGTTLVIRRIASNGPLHLLVSPLLSAEDPLSVDKSDARVLVLVEQPDRGPTPDVRLLRRLYGLTATEAAIAARIGIGE